MCHYIKKLQSFKLVFVLYRMLTDFKGNIKLHDENKLPLPVESILLRGAKLKNTSQIYGIVVYSGPETKFMLNSTKSPLKRSHMDITTNSQVVRQSKHFH